jgi:hypothetical protein
MIALHLPMSAFFSSMHIETLVAFMESEIRLARLNNQPSQTPIDSPIVNYLTFND